MPALCGIVKHGGMPFQRGYLLPSGTMISEMTITDRDGTVLLGHAAEDHAMIEDNSFIEKDEAFQHRTYFRIRVRFADNVYRVGEIFQAPLVDMRRGYAAKRIAQIDRADELESLPGLTAEWARSKTRIMWAGNVPQGFKADEYVTVVASDPATFTVATADGRLVAVPFKDFTCADIHAGQSPQEVEKRLARLTSSTHLPFMTVREAFEILRAAPAIWKHFQDSAGVELRVPDSAAAFEDENVKYLMKSRLFQDREQTARAQATMVNAFTDQPSVDRYVIWLRPGAQNAGTEVHESVHTRSAVQFDRHASTNLNEGITEYFTRLAVGTRFDRTGRYDEEYKFVQNLVATKATSDAILAELYFAGEWAGFTAGLRAYAGDLVSVDAVLTAVAVGQFAGAADYLAELKKDPDAPITT
jgi:hypothetical protein